MNSNRLYWAFLVLCGMVSAIPAMTQPLCRVLLNPAFSYSAYGLNVQMEDSSRTFGIEATAFWDFGDGTGVTLETLHYFQVPGTYEVCLTLTALELPCAVTYCRSVVVRASGCAVPFDAYFDWSPAGTNTVSLNDGSGTFSGTNTLWEFGDGDTSNSIAPTHTWFLPGEHFVSLTKWNDSCVTTYGAWVAVDGNVTTCAPPGLFLDFEPNYTGPGVEFVPEVVTNNVVPAFYIWSYGDGVIDTTVVGYHEYPGEGPYQACCLVGAVTTFPTVDSCFALTCRTVHPYTATDIMEVSDNELRVHPNPFSENLQVDLGNEGGPVTIQLMDMLGRTALETTTKRSGFLALDTQMLPPGPYLLMISGPTKVQRTKVIKAAK